MAKDPAMLFYTSDFIIGTMAFTDEQVGKYIRLLCMQHQHGHLTMKEIMSILKTKDEDILSKFVEDERGLFYNERLDFESEKRKKYTKSRLNNLLGSTHMNPHMENENVNEDINVNTNKKNRFVKPTLAELTAYFSEINYTPENIAEKFLNFYESKGWVVGKTKMKDWKAACRTWKSNGFERVQKQGTGRKAQVL